MKRVFIYLIALLPIGYFFSRLLVFDDIHDPIKYIYTITGVSATIILFFSIIISMIKNKINLMKYRKEIGLFGFFYTFLHLLNFVIFDASFDLQFILKQTIEKPFIYLGMIAFLILLFLAITSSKNLFKKFNSYHKLVYVSLILITIHWVMGQKSLNIEQLIYLVMIFVIAFYKCLQLINNKVFLKINKN